MHPFPIRVRQHEVVHQMIEWLATDGDVQGVHACEVGGGQVTRLMNLPKDDGLAWSVDGSPLPHATLKRAAMRVEELTWVHLPQPIKEHLGAQSRLGLKLLFNLCPDRGKGIDTCPVETRRPLLFANAGECFLVAIIPSRLGTHASSPCRYGQGHPQTEVAIQTPHLAIRNHRTPPKLWELCIWPDGQKEGIPIVGGWGILIVARHRFRVSM